MTDRVGEQKLYYGVANGKKPGIYTSWGLCYKHTNKVSGILFKGFSDIEECIEFMVDHSSVTKADLMVYEEGRSKGKHVDEFIEGLSNIMSEVGVTQDDDMVMLIHPILSYIAFSLNGGTIELIKQAVAGYFTSDDICEAKDLIFTKCDEEVIGVKKSRRIRDGDARSKTDHDVMDIIEALNKLDAAGKTPDILIKATDLHLIPRSKPEELQSITLVDRVGHMEEKMRWMQEAIDKTFAVNMSLNDRVSDIEKDKTSYAEIAKRNAQTAPATRPKISTVIPAVNPAALGKNHYDNYKGLCVKMPEHNEVCDPAIRRTQSTFSVASNNSAEYQYPRSQEKRQRRQYKIIKGKTTAGLSFKGAPVPDRHLFIHRVDSTVSISDVNDHLVNNNFTVRKLECVSHDMAKYKSFKLTVPVDQFSKLFDEDLWPEGVRVRKYSQPWEREKENHNNGDE